MIWVIAAIALFPVWGRRDSGSARAAALGGLLLGLAVATAVAIVGANQTAPGTAGTGAASGSDVPGASASPAGGSSGSPPGLPSAGASPGPGLIFARYEVVVEAGAHQIFRVDSSGTVTTGRPATFSRRSTATVDRVVAPGGLLYWRTIAGFYAGWSYLPNRSGPFSARTVFTDINGGLHYADLGQTGK
ncbi:MAG: hypothetical protein M3R49_10160 [Chloroflexota bacterium]|nr:hypothetical protein [Chloroflexota bacterium]